VIEERDGKGRFVKGNKAAQIHGACSIKEKGELPFTEEREEIEKHLGKLQLSLEEQFGKKNGKAEILIGQIITHEAIIEHLKLYLHKIGSPVDMYRRGKRNIAEAQPCVRDLLQHMTAQRHALKELEAEGDGQRAKTLMELAREIEEEEETGE